MKYFVFVVVLISIYVNLFSMNIRLPLNIRPMNMCLVRDGKFAKVFYKAGIRFDLKNKLIFKKIPYIKAVETFNRINTGKYLKYRVSKKNGKYIFSLPDIYQDELFDVIRGRYRGKLPKLNYKKLRIELHIGKKLNKNQLKRNKFYAEKYSLKKSEIGYSCSVNLEPGTYIYWYEIKDKRFRTTEIMADPFNGNIFNFNKQVEHYCNEIEIDSNLEKNKNGEINIVYQNISNGMKVYYFNDIDTSSSSIVAAKRSVYLANGFSDWILDQCKMNPKENYHSLQQINMKRGKYQERIYYENYKSFNNTSMSKRDNSGFIYGGKIRDLEMGTFIHETTHSLTLSFLNYKFKKKKTMHEIATKLLFTEGLATYYQTIFEPKQYVFLSILNNFKYPSYSNYAKDIVCLSYLNSRKAYVRFLSKAGLTEKDFLYLCLKPEKLSYKEKYKLNWFYGSLITVYYDLGSAFVSYLFKKYPKSEGYMVIKNIIDKKMDTKKIKQLISEFITDIDSVKKKYPNVSTDGESIFSW